MPLQAKNTQQDLLAKLKETIPLCRVSAIIKIHSPQIEHVFDSEKITGPECALCNVAGLSV